jgi:SAM-dependent methyltransferase
VSDLLREQKRYYAERAPEYDDWWYRRGRYELSPEELALWEADVAEATARLHSFAPRGNVLELAAGTGIWTRQLVTLADRVVAVDGNAETLALNTPEAEHVVADLFAWRPEERFDVVFFSFWLSHVPEERFEEFWTTVRAALAPGGRVFLVDSGPGSQASEEEPVVRQLADGREFRIVKRYWAPDRLAERMHGLGFALELSLTENRHFVAGGGAPL